MSGKKGMRWSKEARENGRNIGERCGHAKLTWPEVAEIRTTYKPWHVTIPMLAKKFGVSQQEIQHIIYGKRWVFNRPRTSCPASNARLITVGDDFGMVREVGL